MKISVCSLLSRIVTSIFARLPLHLFTLCLSLVLLTSDKCLADWKSEVTTLVNTHRQQQGLGSLEPDVALEYHCEKWAATIANTEMRHRRDLKEILTNNGWASLCENLFRGTKLDPREIVALWMASKPHRYNLLRPDISLCGLASFYSQKTGWTVVWMGSSVNNSANQYPTTP